MPSSNIPVTDMLHRFPTCLRKYNSLCFAFFPRVILVSLCIFAMKRLFITFIFPVLLILLVIWNFSSIIIIIKFPVYGIIFHHCACIPCGLTTLTILYSTPSTHEPLDYFLVKTKFCLLTENIICMI